MMASGNLEPYQWLNGDLRLQLHIQPKAKNHAISGRHGDRIKLQLAAPPVDNKANTALVDFLAGEFGVSKSSVLLLRGKTARHKTVLIRTPKRTPQWLDDPDTTEENRAQESARNYNASKKD